MLQGSISKALYTLPCSYSTAIYTVDKQDRMAHHDGDLCKTDLDLDRARSKNPEEY